jgi:anti-sigma regulatory factor (Ser/Thr protein kinase)
MKTLVLPGTLDALEPLGDFVRTAAIEAGFDASAAGRLHLAVDEMATNSITHAYQEQGREGPICLDVETDERELRLHLEDTGPAYDPTTHADPTDLNRPLEERGMGGLGIFLARRNVDAVRYERRGDRNRLTFVLKRPPGGHA